MAVHPFRDHPRDPQLSQPAAMRLAERVARKYWMGRRMFAAAVTDVSSRSEELVRVLVIVHRRAIVHDLVPARDDTGTLGVLPPASAIADPWSADSGELARQPRILAVCPRCNGEARVPCEMCRGAGRRVCRRCGGSGVASSRADGSQVRCPTVEACACGTGRMICPACEGAARVRGRLAVAEQELEPIVRFQPIGPLADAFTDLLEPSDFDAEPASWPAPLVEDTRATTDPDRLPEVLRPSLDPIADRIRTWRLQRFRCDVHTIRYRTFGADGELGIVVGDEPRLWLESDTRPLARRRRAMVAGALGTLGAIAALLWA